MALHVVLRILYCSINSQGYPRANPFSTHLDPHCSTECYNSHVEEQTSFPNAFRYTEILPLDQLTPSLAYSYPHTPSFPCMSPRCESLTFLHRPITVPLRSPCSTHVNRRKSTPDNIPRMVIKESVECCSDFFPATEPASTVGLESTS